MILRKLSEGIRRQDWFTVVVEVLIVVVGIYIGLQVDDWNSQRIALKSEAEYLERLARETDRNLATYRSAVEGTSEVRDILLAYYRHVEGAGETRPDDATLLGQFCHPGFVSSLTYDNSVLEEMRASGVLARLQDVRLRSELANYLSRQRTWNQLIVDSSQEYKEVFRFIDQFRQWTPASKEQGFANCIIDFPALEAADRALHYIASYQRFMVWYHSSYSRIADTLETVRELLPGPSESEKISNL